MEDWTDEEMMEFANSVCARLDALEASLDAKLDQLNVQVAEIQAIG